MDLLGIVLFRNRWISDPDLPLFPCGIINSYTNAIGRDHAILITYSFGFLRRRITTAPSSFVYQQTYAGKNERKEIPTQIIG